MNSTTRKVIDQYNSVTRRPTVADPQKRRIMYKSFRRIFGRWLPSDKRVQILDVACGEGSLLRYLRDSGFSNLSGFDLSSENVNICHELGLDFVVQYDIRLIEKFYPDFSYDFIFFLDILEHISKQDAVSILSEIGRKLKSGGLLLIKTPNMGSLYGVYHRYNDLTHEFGVTEKTLFDLLLTSGFSQDNINIIPVWNATTTLGLIREVYLRIIHLFFFLGEDSSRPKIPTKNLLAIVVKQ